MKTLATLLLVLTVAGCVAQTNPIPDWNLVVREDATPVTDPEDLPDLCPIEVIENRGTWSNECWKALEAYEIVAETNTTIAASNAAALRHSDDAYDAILEAAKLQQQLSQIRQDLLNQERRGRMLDNWFYRGIIVLGLAGASL